MKDTPDRRALRSTVTLGKVPGYPSTSLGPEAHRAVVGIVVGADALTWTVRLPDRDKTTITMAVETGEQILSPSDIDQGKSPWFWPPRAVWEQHKKLKAVSAKYRPLVEKIHKELGTAQRRIEVLGRFVK